MGAKKKDLGQTQVGGLESLPNVFIREGVPSSSNSVKRRSGDTGTTNGSGALRQPTRRRPSFAVRPSTHASKGHCSSSPIKSPLSVVSASRRSSTTSKSDGWHSKANSSALPGDGEYWVDEGQLRNLPGCSLELSSDLRSQTWLLRRRKGDLEPESSTKGGEETPLLARKMGDQEGGGGLAVQTISSVSASPSSSMIFSERPNSPVSVESALTVTPLLLHLIQLGLANFQLPSQRSPSENCQPGQSSHIDNQPVTTPLNDGNCLKQHDIRDWSASDLDVILRELESIHSRGGKVIDALPSTGLYKPDCASSRSAVSTESGSAHQDLGDNTTMPSFNVGMTCASAQTSSNGGRVKGGNRIESPDNDSAFSDNGSMLSSESSSSGMSGSKLRAGGNTAHPPHAHLAAMTAPPHALVDPRQFEPKSALFKAEQINLAVEKLKSAELESTTRAQGPLNASLSSGGGDPTKKLFVKFFCADGSTKSILVDGAMCVGDVLDVLIEKNHVQPEPSWGLVEHIPELYMERCLEDHENMFALLSLWRPEAKNKILFVPRTERYDLFRRPERYLLGINPRQQSPQDKWDQEARQSLLHEVFFQSDEERNDAMRNNNQDAQLQGPATASEIEGPLWIKSEGKKTWKKYYFILRHSGLFHVPRGKKPVPCPERDLIPVVSSFGSCQVYQGVGWKKKFKAPTDFTLAIKPPHVQVKSPKHIRYLCAENEIVLQQWCTMVRILKNKKQMLENYNLALAKMQVGTGKEELRQELLLQRTAGLGSHLGERGAEECTTSSVSSASVMTYSRHNDLINPLNVTGEPRLGGSHSGSSSEVTYLSDETCCHSQQLHHHHHHLDGSLTSTVTTSSGGSLPSSSNTSISSGCVSETSSVSENGFDADYHDGGTIKRKPANGNGLGGADAKFSMDEDDDDDDDPDGDDRTTPTPSTLIPGLIEVSNTIRRRSNDILTTKESSLPPPPLDPDALLNSISSIVTASQLNSKPGSILTRSGSDISLNSLPPPPEELKFPLRYQMASAAANGVINNHHLIMPQLSSMSIGNAQQSALGPSPINLAMSQYGRVNAGNPAVVHTTHPPDSMGGLTGSINHAALHSSQSMGPRGPLGSIQSTSNSYGSRHLPQSSLAAVLPPTTTGPVSNSSSGPPGMNGVPSQTLATGLSGSTYLTREQHQQQLQMSQTGAGIPVGAIPESQRNALGSQMQVGVPSMGIPRSMALSSCSNLHPYSSYLVNPPPTMITSVAGHDPLLAQSHPPSQLLDHGEATRDQLYPCGVFRAVHPSRNPTMLEAPVGYPRGSTCPHNSAPPASGGLVADQSQLTQMDLLKRLPNNAPPRPFTQEPLSGANRIDPQPPANQAFLAAAAHRLNEWNQAYSPHQPLNQSTAILHSHPSGHVPREKRITFDEVVHHINLNSNEPLKMGPDLAQMHAERSSGTTSWLQATGEPFPTPSSTVRNPHPGRLFETESQQAKDTPPRAFLNDLQRVMKKKWAVAQRFHHASVPASNSPMPAKASNNKAKETVGASVVATKSRDEILTEQEQAERFANHYSERDVSKWILQSLKHSHIQEIDMSQDLVPDSKRPKAMPGASISSGSKTGGAMTLPHENRPKIYNGRRVPNCFPPPCNPDTSTNGSQGTGPIPPSANTLYCLSHTNSNSLNHGDDNGVYGVQHLMPSTVSRPNALALGSRMAPTPPRRSMNTHLTSPR